ncbi:MAG TPA: hypothetical protein VEH04_09365 [Verrucomicrobiae bacterium]|nr:hypothetical protein [Verrucomicrobiae bacterium]
MKAGNFKMLLILAATCAAVTAWLFAAPENVTTSKSAVTARSPAALHPVHIRRVGPAPRVLTALTNHSGVIASVSCSSCHSTTTPDRATHSAAQLDRFHQGLVFQHGNQSCLNCHHEGNYDALRLANGTSLEYADVMQLCGQCHGLQKRDFERGLHGGMNGYWDLTRGPRTRNSCTHCHDPHAPAYPTVRPVLPPKDRIAVPH